MAVAAAYVEESFIIVFSSENVYTAMERFTVTLRSDTVAHYAELYLILINLSGTLGGTGQFFYAVTVYVERRREGGDEWRPYAVCVTCVRGVR